MQIDNLKKVPQYLLPLAQWHQAQWQVLNPGQTLQQRIDKMQLYLNDDFIPTTFVASAQQLLGSAAIVQCDMDIRPQLMPWLASVYVDKTQRQQGIGSQLVRHVMQQAAEQGIERLYLYTPDQQNFYKKLGWRIMEKIEYHGSKVCIMQADLTKFEVSDLDN